MTGVRGLVEVVLFVADMPRSVHFYRDLLGLTVISPPGVPATFLRVGEARDGIPRQVVLVPRPSMGDETGRPNLHHFGLEIDAQDFEAERERLGRLGLAVRGGTHPFLPVDAFYVDDPDGNEVEFVCLRGAGGGRDG